MGAWMKVNGEAIYGTKRNPLAPVTWGRITLKESKKELHYIYLSSTGQRMESWSSPG
jgi:hypothetical protein